MKKLLAVALLVPACVVHTDRETNAPGIVAVEKPPKDLTERTPVKPTDPGERGVAVQVSATLHGVGWTRVGQPGHEVYLPFSLEIAPWPFTLEKSHSHQVSNDALDGAVRPAIGLAFRAFVKAGSERTELGPMWYEIQYVSLDPERFSGVTLGAGITTTYKHVGPQATLCAGIPLALQLCARGTWTTNEHAGLQVYLTYNGFAEWVWSR